MLGLKHKTVYFAVKKKTLQPCWFAGFSSDGVGGIRTHVALPPNAFRVRPVMTASIPLPICPTQSHSKMRGRREDSEKC